MSAAVEKLHSVSQYVDLSCKGVETHICHLRVRMTVVCGMSEYATGSLDTEGQRADVNQDKIFSALLTGENTTLDSSTISNSFIGVG